MGACNKETSSSKKLTHQSPKHLKILTCNHYPFQKQIQIHEEKRNKSNHDHFQTPRLWMCCSHRILPRWFLDQDERNDGLAAVVAAKPRPWRDKEEEDDLDEVRK
jgi:hypothetical protein